MMKSVGTISLWVVIVLVDVLVAAVLITDNHYGASIVVVGTLVVMGVLCPVDDFRKVWREIQAQRVRYRLWRLGIPNSAPPAPDPPDPRYAYPGVQEMVDQEHARITEQQRIFMSEQARQMMNAAQGPMNTYPAALGSIGGLLGTIDGGEIRYPNLAQGLGLTCAPPTTAVQDPSAVARARTLLIEAIGAEAVARLEAGGGYPIKSTLWPGVIYVVPKMGKVLIIRDGYIHGRACIDVAGDVPWPDHVLTRIRSIQADETVVFCTGNIS